MSTFTLSRNDLPAVVPRHELWAGQGPVVLGTIALTAFLQVESPDIVLRAEFVVSLFLVAVATVIGFAIHADRPRRQRMVLIPVLGLAAVFFARLALIEVYPSSGLLIIFPALWLGAAFTWRVLPATVTAVFFATLFPLGLAGDWPVGASEWAEVLQRPGAICFFTVVVHVAATFIRSKRAEMRALSRRLQAALDAAEQRAESVAAVLDSVDAAVMYFDAAGQLVMANAAAGEYAAQAGSAGGLGLGATPLVFYPDRMTPVEASDQMVPQALAGTLEQGALRWIGPPDAQRAVRATSRDIRSGAGERGGVVVVAYDVTMLIEAVNVREDFLATTSHELRTPLTSIIGYLELIDAEALGIVTEVTVIERNALRLFAMISNLLDAGCTTPLNRVETDVAPLLEAAVECVRDRAASSGVTVMLLECAPVVANVDAGALKQVVDNLLSNAVKFTRESGRVTVGLARDDAALYIEVADTGMGVSAEDQRQMFDRFFRARSSRMEAIPGAGLGLSITKSIVEAHGGEVTVESAVGEGTTMTVRLPLR